VYFARIIDMETISRYHNSNFYQKLYSDASAAGEAEIKVLEVIAGIDYYNKSQNEPDRLYTNPDDMMNDNVVRSQLGRFGKFYKIVTNNQLPNIKSFVQVEWTDTAPHTAGVIHSFEQGAREEQLSDSSPSAPGSFVGSAVRPLKVPPPEGMSAEAAESWGDTVVGRRITVRHSPTKPGRNRAYIYKGKSYTEWQMTREELRTWAGQIGVTPELLLMAQCLYSEVGHIKNDTYVRAVMCTMINGAIRQKRSIINNILGNSGTTGAQGRKSSGGFRYYATSRLIDGEKLEKFLNRVANMLINMLEAGDTTKGSYMFQSRAYPNMEPGDPGYEQFSHLDREKGKGWGRFEFVHDKWTSKGMKHVKIMGTNDNKVRFYADKISIKEEDTINLVQDVLGGELIASL